MKHRRVLIAGISVVVLCLVLASVGWAKTVVELPVMVNIHGFDKGEAERIKTGVRLNFDDVNKLFRRNACDIEIEPTFIFNVDPDAGSSYRAGTDALSDAWTAGLRELSNHSQVPRGKGQKIYVVRELSGHPAGLAQDGQPVFMLERGFVGPMRQLNEAGTRYVDVADWGQYFLHEMGHNADLDHRNGTFMQDTLARFGAQRDPSRTITDTQCRDLLRYFQGRGTARVVKEPPEDDRAEEKVGRYDSNGDCRLGDGEFLVAMDEWIGAEIDDPTFLSAMDAWIQQTNVCSADQGDGDTGVAMPSALTPVCTLGELSQPCDQLQIRQPEVALGLGFDQAFTVPAGAIIDLTVSSPTGGVRFTGGNAVHPALEGSLQPMGDDLFARLTARQDARLDPVREFLLLGLSLTALDVASAQIRIAGTLTTSSGEAVTRSFTWTLELLAMLQGLSTDGLAVHGIATSVDVGGTVTVAVSGAGVERVSVQVRDLSGRLIDERSQAGSAVRWTPATTGGRPLANGVYLYTLSVQGEHDDVVMAPRKLAVLR